MKFDDGCITYRWYCTKCHQEWPVRTSAQATRQRAVAATVHPGEECEIGPEGATAVSTKELHAWRDSKTRTYN